MFQISSFMAATEGPEAKFSSFANFDERKRKSNLLMSFPKIVHQKGSFGQKRKNPLFCFCRPILHIFGLTLLMLPFDTRLVRPNDNRLFSVSRLIPSQERHGQISGYFFPNFTIHNLSVYLSIVCGRPSKNNVGTIFSERTHAKVLCNLRAGSHFDISINISININIRKVCVNRGYISISIRMAIAQAQFISHVSKMAENEVEIGLLLLFKA